ncbi:MAG: hypothetical protein IKG18_16070 [Atopobiaceae bacterium]|nr:hypothetical protein [Atopobiaceae bacterium]
MGKLYSRVIAAGLCGCLALAGCTAGNSSNSGSSVPDAQTGTDEQGDARAVSGEWKTNTEPSSTILSAEQEAVFNKATEGVEDVSFGPVAVIGQQVVAGMNYAYLCQNTYWEGDATPEWAVVTIYNDLEGNAKIVEEKSLDVADVRTSDSAAERGATGAWATQVPEKASGQVRLPKPAQKAFDAASKAHGDASLTPVALLGTQGEAASGTDYRFVAIEAQKGEEQGAACVVDVYEDASGTYAVGDSAPLDLAYYVTR